MLLEKLQMRNFGPYYKDHSLQFASDPSAPVTLIHGENLRGKTSLLNAIRWCLYGAASARSEGDIPTNELISYDAVGDGNFTMRVGLKFTHDDESYELERHVQSDTRPESDAQLEERLHLERDGQFVGSAEIDRIIKRILHPEVSRFFLFDAELLEDYEVLVGDEEYEREVIKDSIERILGLPALISAGKSLKELERSAAKEQNKQVEAREENERLVAQEEQLESEVESLEDDLKHLLKQREDLKDEIRELRKRQKQYASARSDVEQIEKLEAEIDSRQNRRDELLEECQKQLSRGWWQPVAWKVQNRLDSIQAGLEEASKKRAQRTRLEEERRRIKEALEGEGEDCPLCNREITDQAAAALKEKLESVRSELEGIDLDDGTGGRGVSEVERLRDYQSTSNLERVVAIEERIRRLDIEIDDRERDIDTIRDRLKNVDEDDVREAEDRYETCIEERSALKEDIEDVREELVEKKDELSKTRREIANLPEADPRVRARRELYSVLKESYDGAVSAFTERMRRDVASEASRVFGKLIREPDYDGLKINKHYGLEIEEADGRIIKRRSAGAAQIVALSLVCALNRSAVREGPLVIDTPLARLDDQHRENVLTHLPELVPQMVLLVQSGELREDDREYLRSNLGREYTLERDGSSTKTRIETEV